MRHAIAILIACASFALTANSGPNVARFAPTRASAAADPYQTDPYAANLIARYDFEGGATDTSGNGQDLTVSGAVNSYAYTNAYGRPEGVYTFDGSDDYMIRTNLQAALWSNQLGVVSFWLLSDDQDAANNWLNIGDADNTPRITMRQNTLLTGNFLCELTTVASGSWLLTASSTTFTGAWLHVVLQHSASRIDCYTNGLLAMSDVSDTQRAFWVDRIFGDTTNSVDFVLGATLALGTPYDGMMDNVKIYSGTTCSVAHVSWLFTNTHPTNCLESR